MFIYTFTESPTRATVAEIKPGERETTATKKPTNGKNSNGKGTTNKP